MNERAPRTSDKSMDGRWRGSAITFIDWQAFLPLPSGSMYGCFYTLTDKLSSLQQKA
jgi:hypothetical protein